MHIEGKRQRQEVLSLDMCPKGQYHRLKPHKITATMHIAVLSKSVCSLSIRFSREVMESQRYNPNGNQSMSWQREVAALDRRKQFLEGLPCFQCRQLVKVGETYLRKRSGRGTKPYHIACAKALNIL